MLNIKDICLDIAVIVKEKVKQLRLRAKIVMLKMKLHILRVQLYRLNKYVQKGD